jgi:hypothetical protein
METKEPNSNEVLRHWGFAERERSGLWLKNSADNKTGISVIAAPTTIDLLVLCNFKLHYCTSSFMIHGRWNPLNVDLLVLLAVTPRERVEPGRNTFVSILHQVNVGDRSKVEPRHSQLTLKLASSAQSYKTMRIVGSAVNIVTIYLSNLLDVDRSLSEAKDTVQYITATWQRSPTNLGSCWLFAQSHLVRIVTDDHNTNFQPRINQIDWMGARICCSSATKDVPFLRVHQKLYVCFWNILKAYPMRRRILADIAEQFVIVVLLRRRGHGQSMIDG